MPVFGKDHAPNRKRDGRALPGRRFLIRVVDGVFPESELMIAGHILGSLAAKMLGLEGTTARTKGNKR